MNSADRSSPGRPLRSRFREFLSEERGLSVLLALLIVHHLAYPIIVDLRVGSLVSGAFFTLIAAASAVTLGKRPYFAQAARIITFAVLVSTAAEVFVANRELTITTCLVEAIMIAIAIAAVGQQVFQAGPVTPHRIRGAIVIYALLGVLFGLIFLLLAMVHPESFRFPNTVDSSDTLALRQELVYYSYVTLTTVGYGDVAPASPAARSLATFEALSGQLYLAITLARLVSSQAATSDDAKS